MPLKFLKDSVLPFLNSVISNNRCCAGSQIKLSSSSFTKHLNIAMEGCEHFLFSVSDKIIDKKYQNCLPSFHLPSGKWAETNFFQSSHQAVTPGSHYQLSILFD